MSKALSVSLGVAVAVMGIVPTSAIAQHPYPYIEDFENDTDTYNPPPNAFGDPNLDGAPPGDWQEIRTGTGAGVIEEVSSGYLGVPSSRGGFMGAVYPEGSSGPYSISGYSVARPATPVAFRIDLYIDPAMQSAVTPGTGQVLGDGRPGVYGSDGLADFWWTNAVNRNTGGYLTETGFTGEVLDNGAGTRFWRFTPTGDGLHGVDVAVGQWVTLEVVFDPSATKLAATRKVWNQKHTQLLFSNTVTDMWLSPNSVDMGGPSSSWFTQIQSNGTAYPGIQRNIHRLFVDDAGATLPIVQVILGDMDGDGDRDNFDIQPFELALTRPAEYLAAFPGLTDYAYRGDADGNNTFDNFDIQAFERLLAPPSQAAASAAAVPEPSTLLMVGLALPAIFARRRRGRG